MRSLLYTWTLIQAALDPVDKTPENSEVHLSHEVDKHTSSRGPYPLIPFLLKDPTLTLAHFPKTVPYDLEVNALEPREAAPLDCKPPDLPRRPACSRIFHEDTLFPDSPNTI